MNVNLKHVYIDETKNAFDGRLTRWIEVSFQRPHRFRDAFPLRRWMFQRCNTKISMWEALCLIRLFSMDILLARRKFDRYIVSKTLLVLHTVSQEELQTFFFFQSKTYAAKFIELLNLVQLLNCSFLFYFEYHFSVFIQTIVSNHAEKFWLTALKRKQE